MNKTQKTELLSLISQIQKSSDEVVFYTEEDLSYVKKKISKDINRLIRKAERIEVKNMTPTEYVNEVLKTESFNIDEIKNRLSLNGMPRLLHACMGIQTEAGEFCDSIKKAIYYGKKLDVVNLIEELGDLLWYIGVASDVLDVSLESIMEINISKLRARYGEEFSEEAAINRSLDTEREILENSSCCFSGTCEKEDPNCSCKAKKDE